ncbi:MAG: penicillin acylase family protein [Desulfobacterales bacterium]|nr:MAG: penicillin acylase family protein [Desulfobacterales bacterium]
MKPANANQPAVKRHLKLLPKLLASILVLFFWLGVGLYVYLISLQPQLSGELQLAGLHQEVEVIFDNYGIPHIYGQNEEDVYYALGYVHAQERLFQMEMIRRITTGRLAEILGKDLVKTDRFFRTIGLRHSARRAAAKYLRAAAQPYQKAALAYLAGINQFVAKGQTPVEFTLLGIPKEKFGPRDIYLVLGFMAFGFAEGFRVDPIVAKVHQKLGEEYLKDWVLQWPEGAQKIPVFRSNHPESSARLGYTVHQSLAQLPAAPWLGSNGWVVSADKTESGSVILANDTHMAYTQPSVWYEAHLECPGFSFYGHHVAGVPFGLIGHNRMLAWGLTMFENDDVDYYRERSNPNNPNQVWVDDHWEDLQIRQEIINVKGAEPVTFKVRISRHGPIMNEAEAGIAAVAKAPVSVWWAFNQFPTTALQAAYLLAHASGLGEARQAAALVDVPGVNIMYGDREGNIAWWAAAKLVRRPPHVNSKLFLDGAGGKDEPLGFYKFRENPQSENPPAGFVYSANNQPDEMAGVLYPGYYVPEDRARRIRELLEADTLWTVEATRKMSTDSRSPVTPEVVAEIIRTIANDAVIRQTPLHARALQILREWKGDHDVQAVAPTLYYKLLSCITESTFADELGPEDFQAFVSTHLMKRTLAVIIRNDESRWWDDIHSRDIKETRAKVFTAAFDRTVRELERQLGPDISEWRWGRVHTLTHEHVLGRKWPLDKIFNIGPFPVMGGNEVIANFGFRLSSAGHYPVTFGPAMRTVVDLGDIENSLGVNPTGQSGYFLSPHYGDQASLFNAGQFRKQMMNRPEIQRYQKGTLLLRPE